MMPVVGMHNRMPFPASDEPAVYGEREYARNY